MNPGRHTIQEFRGVALDVHRTSLPGGWFQQDVGGDRYKNGSWRRRRGMRHTNVDKKAAALTTLIGFEVAGSGFATLMVAGVQAHGHPDVAEQV